MWRRRFASARRPVRTIARRPARSRSRSSTPRTIGRVRGAADNDYTAGVICAKVARYAERLHHPDRLTSRCAATAPRACGEFAPISGTMRSTSRPKRLLARRGAPRPGGGVALFLCRHHGPRHARRHRAAAPRQEIFRLPFDDLRQSRLHGLRRRASARSPVPIRARWRSRTCIVIWGTNAVNTQVNVMTHATRARKERGAKIAAVDIYMNGTMEQADLAGADPARHRRRARLRRHALPVSRRPRRPRLPRALHRCARPNWKRICATRTPAWAVGITGCDVATIEAFAALIGERKRAFFRLGYGFSRSRNGAANMHAASCIPAVTGAWRHEGGGAFHPIRTSTVSTRR